MEEKRQPIATYGLFAVSARTSGERVSCEIIVNGEVRDQKSANGRHIVADCSAVATVVQP